jgi:putative protease
MVPGEDYLDYTVTTILDEEGRLIDRAPHPQQKIFLPLDRNVGKYSILRRKQGI